MGRISVALLSFMCIGCNTGNNRNVPTGPVYTHQSLVRKDTDFVIHIQGIRNVSTRVEVFLPMAKHLEHEIPGTRFTIMPITDFSQFQKIFLKQQPAIIIANPYETVLAVAAGYDVVASVGEQQFAKPCLVVPAKSSITKFNNLAGKKLALPPVSSFAGTLLPELTLFRYNKQLYHSIEKIYLSTLELPLYLVLDNKADAAFVPKFSWNRFQKNYPTQAQRLKVVAETDSLSAPAVLISNNLKLNNRERIRKALFCFNDLPASQHLQQLLEAPLFFPADNSRYENVKGLIRFFESKIRPVYKAN